MWSGVDSVRVTVPNSTPGQPVITGALDWTTGVAIGLPPLTPKGPNCFRAASPCIPAGLRGHALRVARPAGVGVMPPLVNGLWTLTISLLNPPAKNTRFLTNGPPA